LSIQETWRKYKVHFVVFGTVAFMASLIALPHFMEALAHTRGR